MSRYECLEQVILIKSEQRAIYVTAPISDKCHFALVTTGLQDTPSWNTAHRSLAVKNGKLSSVSVQTTAFIQMNEDPPSPPEDKMKHNRL